MARELPRRERSVVVEGLFGGLAMRGGSNVRLPREQRGQDEREEQQRERDRRPRLSA